MARHSGGTPLDGICAMADTGRSATLKIATTAKANPTIGFNMDDTP